MAVDTLGVFAVMQRMRAVVLEDGLDINKVMRDACKSHTERTLCHIGIMPFSIALSKTFGRLKLGRPTIDAICASFPAGPANEHNDGFEAVSWKQFVFELSTMTPSTPRQSAMSELRTVLQAMRRYVDTRQFELLGTFWTAMRSGRERSIGFMDKQLFKSVLLHAFSGLAPALRPSVVDQICLVWRFGEPDLYGGYVAVNWKKFCPDLMAMEPEEALSAPRPSDELGVNQLPPWLAAELRMLRRYALGRQYDLSEIFEEESAPGLEKNLGLMDTQIFVGVMSRLFGPDVLSRRTLLDLCLVYGTGGQTPPRGGERAGFSHVRAEQFANDFDATLPSEPEPVRPMPAWMGDELRKLRRFAIARRLRLRDGFEEMCPAGMEKNVGTMDATQFRGTLGTLLGGTQLHMYVIDAICDAYGTGDHNARDGWRTIRWRQFALDFDELSPAPPPYGSPPLSDALRTQLQTLRRVAINRRLDLTDAFESQTGPGRERNTGIMDNTQFCCVMGLLFSGTIKQTILDDIVQAYASEAAGFLRKSPVRFKQFALDFDNLEPPPDNSDVSLADYPDWLVAEVRKLRRIAVERSINMYQCFEDQWDGPSREKLMGVIDRAQFCSVIGLLFAGAQKQHVIDGLVKVYGTGDPDPRGGLSHVRWKDFATDFNEIAPAELTDPGQPRW